MSEYIHKLWLKWRLLKGTSLLLWVVAIALPASAVVRYFAPGWEGSVWAVAGLAFVLVLYQKLLVGSEAICAYLNAQYPSLEQSADLLLQPKSQLGNLGQLQQAKVFSKLKELDVQLPHRLPMALLALIFGTALFGAIRSNGTIESVQQLDASAFHFAPQPAEVADSTDEVEPPQLEVANIRVQPPHYSGIATFRTLVPDLEVPYWSDITWELHFSKEIKMVQLLLADGEKVEAEAQSKDRWKIHYRPTASSFYMLQYESTEGLIQQSDYFKLQLIKDLPPSIEVLGLPAYSELVYTKGKIVALNAIVQDDYGIADARIIATLTKGEGEAVQFKNDTLRFDRKWGGRTYQLKKSLDLSALGMAPGDELYLHVEASDFSLPEPNISKTSKYIIAFEDTTKLDLEMYGKMAVDRMPEYFRSQRQIIIDTEKLIAQKAKLEKNTYWEKSNNIAADQKLLRLRYGQFLGEEFETTIGSPSQDSFGDQRVEEGEVEKEVEGVEGQEHLPEGHEHETAEEHAAHAHEHLPEGVPQTLEDEQEEALEPYAHLHDISEEVTYFDAATSTKLRAALGHMWDAELHLRMGRPEQALPYEYKALALIKEVQQASRIYVERVGFEPPIIKVGEKRLSGEQGAIKSTKVTNQKKKDDPFAAIRAAIPVLEEMRQKQGHFPDYEGQQQLQEAGEELAAVVLRQEGLYLEQLRLLRDLLDKQIAVKDYREVASGLLRTFWKVLPEKIQPTRARRSKSRLTELYYEALN